MTAVAAGVVCENSFSEKVVITQKYLENHLSDCLYCINKWQTKLSVFVNMLSMRPTGVETSK